jgi:23S rRNA (guanosine2251-2'-O)-methyltransferase
MSSAGAGTGRRVYGVHGVGEVLRARPEDVQAVFVTQGRRPDAALDQALSRASLEAEPRAAMELDRLAKGGRHQGVVAIVGPYPYRNLDDLLGQPTGAAASPGPGPSPGPLVVLDQVQDPRNLGAIVRSAYALGSAGLVLPERRATGVTATVVRTSAGATEHLPICRVVNLVRALEAMQAAGWWLVGAAGQEGQPPEALDLADPVALILGSEGKGLRPSTAKHCDFHVAIPMAGNLDSLNVSVAAGILLAEAARQRRLR